MKKFAVALVTGFLITASTGFAGEIDCKTSGLLFVLNNQIQYNVQRAISWLNIGNKPAACGYIGAVKSLSDAMRTVMPIPATPSNALSSISNGISELSNVSNYAFGFCNGEDTTAERIELNLSNLGQWAIYLNTRLANAQVTSCGGSISEPEPAAR